MNIHRILNDPDMVWCDVARAYFERYLIANNIERFDVGYSYIRDDELWDARMQELCTEFEDEYDEMKNKEVTLRVIQNILRNDAVLERVCDFEALDEYKLHVGSTMVGKGSLDTINEISLVQYDETKWWFAKGIDDTVLNNAQEVEDYLNSVVRERKYIDVDDNIIQWRPA